MLADPSFIITDQKGFGYRFALRMWKSFDDFRYRFEFWIVIFMATPLLVKDHENNMCVKFDLFQSRYMLAITDKKTKLTFKF